MWGVLPQGQLQEDITTDLLQIYKEETSLPAMSSYYVVDQEDDEVQHVGFPLCPY